MTDPTASRRIAPILVAMIVLGTLIARQRGYKVPGNIAVRCRAGHLYTTLWIPGVNLKALDLGLARLQYCPVGRHWTLVTPVRDANLTEEQRQLARAHHDVWLP